MKKAVQLQKERSVKFFFRMSHGRRHEMRYILLS